MSPTSWLPATLANALVAVASPSVLAQGSTPDSWYAGVGLTYAKVEVCGFFGCLYQDTVERDMGVRLTLGRQVTQRFALELGYVDFGTPQWGDPGHRYHIDVDGLHLGVAWVFPFLRRWQGYIKPGLIYIDASSRVDDLDYSSGQYSHYQIDADDFEFMVEGGVGISLSDDWRIRLGIHFQEIDDRLLDAREGSLQSILLELYRRL